MPRPPSLARCPPQHDIDTRQNRGQTELRYTSDAIVKDSPIERDQLRGVRNGRLAEPGITLREENVTGRFGPFQLGGQWDTDDGRDCASVERIALNDEDGSAKSGPRADRVAEIGPPDVPLPDYHSEFSRILRPAR